jgi:dihydrofolate synthase/folylpolyglutamate synthase
MHSYADALTYLYSFGGSQITALGSAPAETRELRRMRRLLARLGDPQLGRRSVHITGSKGKGSTAAMIAALLRGAGARTGLFTSPHLHHETERYQIDAEPISETDFARIVGEMRPVVEAMERDGDGHPTTFELRTALAFLWYREQRVECQVMEVGIGGTLDATNVLDEKDVCVFTPISLEHTRILGDTVAQIARDKSGILRPGVAAVMGLQRESAADVIRDRCRELGVRLEEVALACQLAPGKADLDGQEARLRTPRDEYRLHLPLLGRHQLENAATAILAVEQLQDAGIELTPAVARAALAEVRWPGRMEVLKRRPLLVVDGAHNSDSARRLVQALRQHTSFRRAVLVVGLNADKDLAAFAREFASLDPEVIATRSHVARAAPPEDVAAAFREAEMVARTAPDVASAVDEALTEAGPDDLICVTGSLYVVAEARAWVLGLLPDPVAGQH